MNEALRRPTRSLHGKVAIVTGAGSFEDGIGNGRAAAIMFAEDGCAVVCADIQLKLAERTGEMITDEGKGRAVAVEADVTTDTGCRKIVQTAMGEYGRLDILFNCVGVNGAAGTAETVDMAEWNRGMEINVNSMVLMTKYAVPAMKGNDASLGYRGSIVNMGSVAGLRGGTPHLFYPTAKGAVVNLTRAMAAHHAKDGIRVNCVCPGMVYTPMMYAKGMSDEVRELRKNRNLLKTEGNGWDVGAAVRYLAGDEGRWLTGLILEVDAGATAAIGIELPPSASVNG